MEKVDVFGCNSHTSRMKIQEKIPEDIDLVKVIKGPRELPSKCVQGSVNGVT